jgi:predicted negative regulator of RcsB-dependent stress response
MDAQTESSDLYLRALAWFHANRKPLVIGLIVVAVIGLGWGFMAWEKTSHETEANTELFAVPIDSAIHSASASPQKLLEVAKEYPSTDAGEYAQLLAADSLFNEAKYPEARQQFSEFIDNHAESTLVPQAKVGLAACLEAEGKTSDAITKYHDIIVMYPSDLNIVSPAKLTLARLYDQENKPELAFNYYAELARMLAQNPYDPWASEARERAQILAAKHPELIKNQASSAQGAAPSGFSVSGTGEPAAPAAQPGKPEAPSGQGSNPNLLNVPSPSTNSTGKP